MKSCMSINCMNVVKNEDDLCKQCSSMVRVMVNDQPPMISMSEKYPKYYKDFSGVDEADVYLVHDRFQLNDCSGALHHASKKILLSGVRTGGKSAFDDIKEAKDTLSRWLEINSHLAQEA